MYTNEIHTMRVGMGIGLLIVLLFLAACAAIATPLDSPESEYEGTQLDGPASDFQLVDHNGDTFRLSDFHGNVVALTFLDSQCEEVCPLTAVHMRNAHQALGDDADSVVFLGVNVNVDANSVADVAATTEKWRLDEIPTWHFLTGNANELQQVWEAYGVGVAPAAEEDGELLHTPGVFVIDPAGNKRWYISTPFEEQGLPEWPVPLRDLLVKHIRALL